LPRAHTVQPGTCLIDAGTAVTVEHTRTHGLRAILDVRTASGTTGVIILDVDAPVACVPAAQSARPPLTPVEALRWLARNWGDLPPGDARQESLRRRTHPSVPACAHRPGGSCGTGLACVWEGYREDLAKLDRLNCEPWAESYGLCELDDVFGVGDWDEAACVAEGDVAGAEARLLGERAGVAR
jgi:hypothetical protein